MRPIALHTLAFIGKQFDKWTSRKFLLVLLITWLVWIFYWSDVKQIYTFNEPEQLKAFVTLSAQKSTTIMWIFLGYLAADGAILMSGNIGGAVSGIQTMRQTFSKTETQTKTSEPAGASGAEVVKNQNTKGDRD